VDHVEKSQEDSYSSDLTKPGNCGNIMATKSEIAMQTLLGRIEALERTVEELRQTVRELSKARRDASLLEVDRIERECNLKPRTAELRQRFG